MSHPWGRLELVSESPVYDLKPFEGRTHPVPQSYALSAPRHAIGRAKDRQGLPTLELPFAVISGKHCVIEKDDNGAVRITDHSSNGTTLAGEMLGKGNSKTLNDGEHITVFQRANTASQENSGPGAVIEYVFRRRDDKPESRAVAQALERQNAQLEHDLKKAKDEVDKLLGQLRESSTTKATSQRDASEAVNAADVLRDARSADQACLKAVACARDLAQRVASDSEGKVAASQKKVEYAESALEAAEARCAAQSDRLAELEAKSKEGEAAQRESGADSAAQAEALAASERARAEAERARDAADKRAEEAEAQRAEAVQAKDTEMLSRKGAERERDDAQARAITSDGVAADCAAFRAAADAAKREADQGVEDQDKRSREKERGFEEVRAALERKAKKAQDRAAEEAKRADAAEDAARRVEASTDQLRADRATAQEEQAQHIIARDAAEAACTAAVALASNAQWRVEQLERGQEDLQAGAQRAREVAAAASRSAAAVGRDVEQLTGALLNQIMPGLQQARQALAEASMAASDTPPGGTQTLDEAAMHDAMPPPPSLPFEYGAPTPDDEPAGGVGATGELDYQNDETQMGEAAPANDASAAADAGDETQELASPGAKRASDATSNSPPPPKRARASLAAADETADEDEDPAPSPEDLDFS